MFVYHIYLKFLARIEENLEFWELIWSFRLEFQILEIKKRELCYVMFCGSTYGVVREAKVKIRNKELEGREGGEKEMNEKY